MGCVWVCVCVLLAAMPSGAWGGESGVRVKEEGLVQRFGILECGWVVYVAQQLGLEDTGSIPMGGGHVGILRWHSHGSEGEEL